MPEPQEGDEIVPEVKTSKILDFFKSALKETKKDKSKPLTKIIVRRLPPRLTKENFLAEFTLPPHDFLYFIRGDLALGAHSFSRAYVNLCNVADTYAFKEKYDDHALRDENGKEYHAVVEWSPVQRVPKKNSQKKKMPKSGTIESDPKYLEFLEKLEEEKNNQTNASEYFHETEITSSKETKVTTTPLLEFIKMKRQKKIDMRNEMRQKKREAEKERRRKEDEFRKSEKSKKFKEEKESKSRSHDHKEEDKIDSGDTSENKSESKGQKEDSSSVERDGSEKKGEKSLKSDKGDKSESKISRRDERVGKKERVFGKVPPSNELGTKTKELTDNDNLENKIKNKKDDDKYKRQIQTPRKSSTGESRKSETPRKLETKSKFRYSEQRNRDREVRNQKLDGNRDGLEGRSDGNDEGEGEKNDDHSRSNDLPYDMKDDEAPGDKARKSSKDFSSGKDPRTERRIRNKDRPSLEIYRPGMGKISKNRMDHRKDDGSSKGSGGSSEPEEVDRATSSK